MARTLRHCAELPAELTQLEVHIMDEIARGVCYADIAKDLRLKEMRVADHVRTIRHKCQARTTAQAAVKLAKAGLI